MSTRSKAPKPALDDRVVTASKDLAVSHARVKSLRRDLRGAEGDVRRGLSLLRKLTTPTTRPRNVGRMSRFVDPTNG